ncbi:MAG: hypothetical protein CR993_07480 [Rhodobacterales bacterium]|nr:MAG: hypothetical protein CR993_07480 [Rhodobacterales bacterium]
MPDKTPTTTLITTAKNEAPYIWEWVAYHRLIGFNNIIMFQNDSDDGTHEIMHSLAKHDFITYKYNRAPRGKHQVKAYWRGAAQPEYQASDWAMALDMDEFLVVRTGDGTVQSLIAALPDDADCAFICWKRFGSSHTYGIEPGLVTERFVMSEHDYWIVNRPIPFKSLFKRERFVRPGIHKPMLIPYDPNPPVYVNGSGLHTDAFELRNFQCTDPNERSLAQINHYITRDPQSFVLKSFKGSAHQANRAIDQDYWKKRNKNQMIDRRIQRFGSALHAEMDAMNVKTNGALRKMTQQAVKTHHDRFEEVMQHPEMRALYAFCSSHPG